MATADVKRTASIYINDVDAQRALKRLQEEAQHLTKRLEQVPNGSKEFKEISNRLVGVQRNMKALGQEAKEQDGWFKKLQGSLGPLGTALAGVFAFDTIKAGFKATLEAYKEHERAVAKVETSLQNVGAQAGVSFGQIEAAANRLQANSLFSDEDILSKVSTSLLNFGNIAGDNFMRAQQAATDLSTTMDGDLQGAAMAVGKALSNPVEGLTALQRMGVRFTDDQKEVIKSLVDTGKSAEAQGIILGELEKRFAGQAAAQAKAEGGNRKLAVAFDELSEGIGKMLSGSVGGFSSWLADGVNAFAAMITPAKTATEAFADQSIKVKDLTSNVSPLLGRYDELSTKANLSATEQGELRTIIDKVAKAVPLAVTEFDKYGKALGLNTDKAREFIKNQQDLLKFQNAEAIKEVEQSLKQLGAEQNRYEGFLNGTNTTLTINGEKYLRTADGVVKLKEDSRGLYAETTKVTLSQEEANKVISDASNRLNEYASQVNGATQQLAELNGETVASAAADGAANKAKEAATEQQEKLSKMLSDARRQLELDGKEGIDKELAQVHDKYAKLREEAAGNADALAQIADMEGQAIGQVRQKYAEKQLEDLAKLDEQITALKATRTGGGEEQEVAAVEAKYAKLEEAAAGHADRLAALEDLKQQDIADIRQKWAEEDQAKREEVAAKEEEERVAGIQAKLDLMDQEHQMEMERKQALNEDTDALEEEYRTQRAGLEDELRQAQKDTINAHYEELYALADEAGVSTVNLQQLHADALLSIDQKAAADAVKITRDKNAAIIDSEKKRNLAMKKVGFDLLDAMAAIWTASAENAAEAETFHKAITLVKMGIDTASAISSMTEKGALTSLTPFDAAIKIAAGIAIVLANIAKATQLLNSSNTPEPPKFAEGGPTLFSTPSFSAGGHVRRPSIGIIGERGTEYVSPNWMYTHPALAPLYEFQENIRLSGRVPEFAAGGSTVRGTALVNATAPSGPMGDNTNTTGLSEAVLLAMVDSVNQLNAQLARGIVAKTSYDQQLEDEDRMNTIKTSANRAR